MTEGFPGEVSVAIVAHNAANTLQETVDSVLASGCPAERITIVDVASTDGAPEALAAVVAGVRLRRLEVNRGPSPGRNVGIREATTPWVFLMDADVMVEPGCIQALAALLRADPTVAVGSPIVVHADRPDVIQYAGTGFHFICEAVNPWLDRPLAERGPAPLDIGAASSCALLVVREAALRAGMFDERYFIGKEDGDFTHRVVLAGYHIVELPQARVRHRSRPRSAWLFYYQIRNRWHVLLKDYQLRTVLLILPVLVLHEVLQAIVLVAKGHGVTYLKALAGLVRMLPRLPADRAAVARIRVRPDRDVLRTDAIVARGDLVGHPLVRAAQRLYEGLLRGYWRLIYPLLARS
ncbi:MAG: glycosyltransferase [Gemmatimonadetes bacterium]|nr:glycosyltransferase [Gemmatimonadota bacterium]